MKKVILTIGIFMFGLLSTFAQTDEKVSDAQLQKFAEAYQTVQQVNQQIQQEMLTAIETEGITAKRFNEIYKAQMDPEVEVDATEDEMAKQKAALKKIEGMQTGVQENMQNKIKEKGLTLEQYEKIGAQLQSNPDLQKKLQGILMKNQTGENPMKK
jgi:3-isopropylmalate dehydratase small subunit